MKVLCNRIIISFFFIFVFAYSWEFWLKPATSPLYTEAVEDYHGGNFARSLRLLMDAYQYDPNDTAVLGLIAWDYFKLGEPQKAEPFFRRAHALSPKLPDIVLGFSETEIALNKYDQAAALLKILEKDGASSVDAHLAQATLDRATGNNREAAREFHKVLELDPRNHAARVNLEQIYDMAGNAEQASFNFAPLHNPSTLTYTTRVNGEKIEWQMNGAWTPTYLAGVDLTAALPGHFPLDPAPGSAPFADWLDQISDLGANTIRVYTILPPAFYRSLDRFNQNSGRPALHLLQGIEFGDAPGQDLFDRVYIARCQKAIRDAIDAIHGQGDFAATPAYPGGIFASDVSPWVAGFLMGQPWLPHTVIANNQLHPGLRQFRGAYLEVPSGSATEIFLAQMMDYAAAYEEQKYNWQHPVAFVNSPALDPMRHPTESTFLEEAAFRRAGGERFSMPVGPFDDDDAISLDPMHVQSTARLPAGYFAAYSAFPFYPDFIDRDPVYRQTRDSEGVDPFFGYLKDLRAHHRNIPLVIAEYGIPSSMGIGHFTSNSFNQGGKTEEEQGRILGRLTRNVFDSGAAGGMIFEWIDEWFRRTWVVRDFEFPEDRKPLWVNAMDPAESFGLMAAEPRLSSIHLLNGDPSGWSNASPLFSESGPGQFHPLGDKYDGARHLKALYADADEGFLYIRLLVEKLGDNETNSPNWDEVNYIIGISTVPGQAGLTFLPQIASPQFPKGMTYAISLTGPESSRIQIASCYNAYHLVNIDGAPGQTALLLKLGWQARLTENGAFEPLLIEPNRRRFARNGAYSPSRRYDRGSLRYGTLDPASKDYDSLAEWHANPQTNSIELRIPWNLLDVTDPSSRKVFAGVERDGGIKTVQTPGFLIEAFAYRPLVSPSTRPDGKENFPIADALPDASDLDSNSSSTRRYFSWPEWNAPEFTMRLKRSYGIVQTTFRGLAGDRTPLGKVAASFARINEPPQPGARRSSQVPGRKGR